MILGISLLFCTAFNLSLVPAYQEGRQIFYPDDEAYTFAGGSGSPINLLAEVGLNLTDSKFWDIGFD